MEGVSVWIHGNRPLADGALRLIQHGFKQTLGGQVPAAVMPVPRHLGDLSCREHPEVLQAQSLLMSRLDYRVSLPAGLSSF